MGRNLFFLEFYALSLESFESLFDESICAVQFLALLLC